MFKIRQMDTNHFQDKASVKNEIEINSVAYRFGIIAAFSAVFVSILLFILNYEFHGLLKWMPIIVFLIILLVAQKQIVKMNSSYAFSFGKLFKVGFIISIIAAIGMLIYFNIYIQLINPDFADKILEISRTEMAKNGLNDEQIEKGIEMTHKFISPTFMMVMSFISSILFGSITSAIGAAIFKNEKV